MERLEKAGWLYSIGILVTKPVAALVAAIPDDAWQTIADSQTRARRRSPRRCSADDQPPAAER